jgi:diguanylate cyclase (GGDEF)-like protein
MNDQATILIVDDEPVNIQTLSAILDDYETLFATDGDQAIRLAREQQPDLILLDIVMPDRDGHQVCRELKADEATHRIPVIFVTGRSEESDEEHGLRLGAVDYVHKPVSPPIVRARVDNHILLKRYSDELETLSTRDPLTGLANRRAFDNVLSYEWRRARRSGHPMSLLMIDVDAFKAYNDQLGHPQGDRCLQSIAEVIAACPRRAADMACRIGGEEFACLLPETPADGAAILAERVRSEVEALALAHPDASDFGVVTVSVGLATIAADGATESHNLMEAADQALYQAKHGGRNRVVAVSPETLAPAEAPP